MNAATTTPLSTAEAAPRRSLRQQWQDMLARFAALPARTRWMVIALLVVIAGFLVNDYAWSLARQWSDEGDAIESVLSRSGSRAQAVNADLRRAISIFGPVVPPRTSDEGGGALTRAVEAILSKHKVVGLSFDRRSGQRMRDSEAQVFGGTGLERLQADVKFEASADELPAILAELESDADISAISALRIQTAGQPGSRRVQVQATIEAWVQSGKGRNKS